VPSAAACAMARRVLPVFLGRLRTLLRLCLEAPLWRLYASSLLLAYESDAGVLSTAGPVRAGVTIIDFAHAYPISRAVPAAARQLAAEQRAHAVEAAASVAGTDCPLEHDAGEVDGSYVHGVRTIIQLFESMLQTASRQNALPV